MSHILIVYQRGDSDSPEPADISFYLFPESILTKEQKQFVLDAHNHIYSNCQNHWMESETDRDWKPKWIKERKGSMFVHSAVSKSKDESCCGSEDCDEYMTDESKQAFGILSSSKVNIATVDWSDIKISHIVSTGEYYEC